MDKDKLEKLRTKYSGATNDVDKSGRFGQVEAALEKASIKPGAPFHGLARLLDAPAASSFDGLDVALVGVPMDLGVTNRAGARFGPRAVRDVDRIGPYNHVLDVVPFAELECGDVGDVPFATRYDLVSCINDIETYFTRVKAAGVKPLTVGGDHSITHPILKALGDGAPLGLVHIDAHCDTSGPFENTRFHHGGPFRNAVLDGVLDPDRTIQIGIRGSAESKWSFSYEAGMSVIHAEEFAAMGAPAVIEKCREVLGDQPFYISLDVDGIDPAFTPGTGTPEVGGLSPREVQQIFHGLKGLNVIGGDVVEVAPQYDPTSNTAQVAGQMLFEILSLMACAE